MIRIDNITKKYIKRSVLNNISLICNSGESIALIGPNGSGKTTLMKSLLGLVYPDKGALYFQDLNIHEHTLYRSHIGYMPQNIRFPGNTSVKQLFNMIHDVRGYEGEPDYELYEAFALEKISSKLLKNLSGGTKQKVNAAVAFLFNPDCYILDEPTAGLDPVAAEILKLKILKEKEAGKLIIISSHIMADLEELTTRVVYLLDGNVFFDKHVDELLADSNERKLGKAISRFIQAKT
jgi:Cu-processing system ATP-binding protein